MALLINGRYLSRPVTGVERYSDMLVQVVAREWPDARILVPRNVRGISQVHRLEVVPTGIFRGHLWEQFSLPRAVGADDVLLSPANTGPLGVGRQAVVIHDLAVIHHPEWFDRRFAAWYSFLLPRLAKGAAGIISVSRTSADDILATFKIPGIKIHVVPPFTTTPAPRSYDHGMDGPYYLMVASRDPRKGLDRAWEWHTSFLNSKVKLVLVGRRGRNFRAQPPLVDLKSVIHLTDVDDERLAALYSGAIALLQPSRFEGFGLPILEALQHGCPVIASDLPVFREVFGDAIQYADIGANRTMIAPVMKVSDPEQRGTIIAKGREHAATFSMQRTSIALHRALDPLLNT